MEKKMAKKNVVKTESKPVVEIKVVRKPKVETKPVDQAIAKATEKLVEKVKDRVDELQVTELVKLAQEQGLAVSETSGFYKVEGRAKGLRLYVAKKGSRLDLSGFCVTHPAVKPITEAEAKAKRIGKVRGQVLNALPADFKAAYHLALQSLAVASALMLIIR